MRGNGTPRLVALGALLALVGSVAAAQAASPFGAVGDLLGLGGPRVEADKKKEYRLTEEHGPWLIMACTFSGPNAEGQAHDLVIDLREHYKLEAFVYKAEFKLDDPNAGRDQDPFHPRVHLRYKKKFRRPGEIEETAVVVGNFPALDDPTAQKTLQTLRYAEPESLKVDDGKTSSRTLASLRAIQQDIQNQLLPADSEKRKRGPMGHAFITTNPLLPADYYAPKRGIDEMVLRMNKGVTYSLLDCPGRYTVQVAHFMGKVIIDQREIAAIENGKPMQSGLTQAAEKAHVLTEALRMKGYEAYEFHDRFSSIVTVGSFNSVGSLGRDGKTELNPAVHHIMKLFAPQPGRTLDGKTALAPVRIVGILCDIQPLPVEVPKRSISRELAQGL